MAILRNGLWLLVPPLLWNVLLWEQLPPEYSDPFVWDNIPEWILWMEQILRMLTFGLPFFLKLTPATPQKWLAWAFYLGGCLIYFASWLLVIHWEPNPGFVSWLTYLAPAYTPLIWLLGIFFLTRPWTVGQHWIRHFFLFAVVLFCWVHTYHAYLAFSHLPG
jgi:hypothetical protein